MKKVMKHTILISLAALAAMSSMNFTDLSGVSARRIRHPRIKRVIRKKSNKRHKRTNKKQNKQDNTNNDTNQSQSNPAQNTTSKVKVQVVKDLGDNPNPDISNQPVTTNDTTNNQNQTSTTNKPVVKINNKKNKKQKKQKKQKYTGPKKFILAKFEYAIYRKNTPKPIWQKWYAVLPINQRIAKEYIGWHESNSRWNVMSSSYQRGLGYPIGRYQVSQGYFPKYARHNINLIYKNKELQEKVADNYLKSPKKPYHGSWIRAAKFWVVNHWW